MGWTSLSIGDTMERMAVRVLSDMSILIMSREPGIQCISTGVVVKAFFSVLKVEQYLSDKSQVEPLWVRQVSGMVMLE